MHPYMIEMEAKIRREQLLREAEQRRLVRAALRQGRQRRTHRERSGSASLAVRAQALIRTVLGIGQRATPGPS